MPEITRYTRQVQPQQVIQARATPEAYGANQSGAAAMGEALQQAGNMGAAYIEKKNTREDILSRARESEQFHREVYDEYNRTLNEVDLTDPNAARQFNQKIRETTSKYISNHRGSEDSRARLEAQLLSAQSQFVDGMNTAAYQAQQKFIMAKAGDQINSIAKQAYSNPESLPDLYKQTNAVIDEYGGAMTPEDRISILKAGQEQIAVNVLNSYVDNGRYEEAKGLINENPFFMDSLRPEVQKNLLVQIQSGINARDKEVIQMKNKIDVLKSAANELGVDVSPTQIYSAATGIDINKDTAQKKIDAFATAINKDPNDLPVSVIAKVGFGVDLPSKQEIDYNKEYTPDGTLSPKGIGAAIKPSVNSAIAAKTYNEKVQGAIELFKRDGNKQALLSAMVTFQKALDDGAAVREGDIVLQREAQSLSDKISTWSSITGQVIGDELINEMSTTMNDFTQKALESSKNYIDPYLSDATQKGYRMLDIGIPQQSYDQVFSGIKTKSDKKADVTNKIQSIAKQNGMTVEELIQSTAQSSGKSVEQVKKDFGID